MNEELIKKLMKYKLNAAGKIADHMPPEISKELKRLGGIIVESINENYKENKDNPEGKPSDRLNNIPIE